MGRGDRARAVATRAIETSPQALLAARFRAQARMVADREVFLTRWSARVDEPLRPTDEQLAARARSTEGFAFAYLKELCLSAVLRWMKSRSAEGI